MGDFHREIIHGINNGIPLLTKKKNRVYVNLFVKNILIFMKKEPMNNSALNRSYRWNLNGGK